MSDFSLKDGDFVYIPSACSTAQKVKSIKGTNLFKANCYTFFDSGYIFGSVARPAGKIAFPATQEWYDKLVVIYPDLEPPPKKKEPREVIEAMLEDGWDCVVCTVGNCQNMLIYVDLISSIDDSSDTLFLGYNDSWRYACPFAPKAGKSIIDYVDGEVVLED